MRRAKRLNGVKFFGCTQYNGLMYNNLTIAVDEEKKQGDSFFAINGNLLSELFKKSVGLFSYKNVVLVFSTTDG